MTYVSYNIFIVKSNSSLDLTPKFCYSSELSILEGIQ